MSQFGGGGGGLSPTPWYKENPFWGSIGGFFTFAIAGLAFGTSGQLTLGKWLLALAWPWGAMAIWLALNGLTNKKSIRVAGSIAAIFGLGAIIALSVVLMEKANAPPVAVKSENQSPNAVPKSPSPADIAEESAKKVPSSVQPPKNSAPAKAEPLVEVVSHPYDLSGDRRKKFLSLLKPGANEHDVLRIGCMASSDSSCVAAGKFIVLFSEAGWTIDSNRVFRAEPTIPNDGVSFVTHIDKEPPEQPPHLGTWHLMSPSQVKIAKVFLEMGIPSSGSGALDIPVGTLGVYFGPEPRPQAVELQLVLSNCEPASESCDVVATSTETHGSFVTNGNAHQLIHAKRTRRALFQPDSSDKQFFVNESELPKKLTLGRCGGKVCRLIVRKFTNDGIIVDSRESTIIGDDGKMRSVIINWEAHP